MSALKTSTFDTFNADYNVTILGIISHQASRNAVSIFLGTVAGAVNTVFVLPLAFEGFEEGWGLLKVLTAYAMIFSQFFHGGIPNAIIRYFPRIAERDRSLFLGRLFLIPLFGSLGFLLIIGISGSTALRLVNPEDAELLANRMPELFVLTTVLTFFFALNGYVSAILKTTLFQFLNETFLKSWYLIIAVLFLLDHITFDTLLITYIAGYVLATVMLTAFSFRQGFRVRLRGGQFPIAKREIMGYSLYSILDRGASIVVMNLDIIMIGLLIGLEEVAFYTLAFYIGAVAMMPQKSILTIANPIASAAMARNDRLALERIYIKSSTMQLLLGGIVFVGIWVSIDEVMVLLPEKFSGGKWVVFAIGVSKLIQMATGVSGGILAYSKHFRLNFYLNLVLVVLTIGTNYLFMHREGLNLGITGAAIATALAYLVHNLFKVVFIHRHFTMTPFTRDFGLIAVVIFLASLGYFWSPLPSMPVAAILLKSGLVSVLVIGIARLLGLLPKLRELLRF